jgi:hypothetical protein
MNFALALHVIYQVSEEQNEIIANDEGMGGFGESGKYLNLSYIVVELSW